MQQGDRVEAQRLLDTFEAAPGIKEAILFGPNREVFARFTRTGESQRASSYGFLYGGRLQWPGMDSNSVVFSREGVLISRSIPLAGAQQGGLFAHLSLDQLPANQSNTLWFVSLVFLLALSIAWLVVRRMVSVVTRPIENLLEAVHLVRDEGNYTVRVNNFTEDEFGDLS